MLLPAWLLVVSAENRACFCIDICNFESVDLADRFVASTRGVLISSASSPWHRYFSAVYNGRVPLPLDLGRVNAFYLNTPAWRRRHSEASSPFRDCYSTEPRCPTLECKQWHDELGGDASLLPSGGRVVSMHWPMWLHTHAGEMENGERMVQLLSTGTGEHDRLTASANHTWVEVMRSDSRPYFQEGQRLPECIEPFWDQSAADRARLVSDGSLGEEGSCFHLADQMGGGRHPIGCWARPVVGSGVWLNVGRTVASHALADIDLSAGSLLRLSYGGIDTLQFRFGDGTTGVGIDGYVNPPLLLITRPECVGRQHGIKAWYATG